MPHSSPAASLSASDASLPECDKPEQQQDTSHPAAVPSTPPSTSSTLKIQRTSPRTPLGDITLEYIGPVRALKKEKDSGKNREGGGPVDENAEVYSQIPRGAEASASRAHMMRTSTAVIVAPQPSRLSVSEWLECLNADKITSDEESGPARKRARTIPASDEGEQGGEQPSGRDDEEKDEDEDEDIDEDEDKENDKGRVNWSYVRMCGSSASSSPKS